jgi:hypothetical protein
VSGCSPPLDFSGQPIELDSPLFDTLWQQRAAELSVALGVPPVAPAC